MKIKHYSKKEMGIAVKNAGLVVLGSIVLAFGFGIFLMPYDLIIGGVGGIAIVLADVFEGISGLEFFTVDVLVAILTWGLFFLGLIFLGWDFALKTLISTIVYPPALSLCMKLARLDILDGFFMFTQGREGDIAVLTIAAVFGGLIVGAGCALAYRGGGSTGGTDILALILAKYIKRLKSSVAIFITDATVIILGVFVFRDLIICLLGIVAAFVGALVIDKVLLGQSQAFIAHIVSDKYEDINEEIIKRLDRTSTIIHATGGFSGEGKPMIMVSFNMPQYAEFMMIMKRIDPDAFVTIHRAHEVNGEGWTKHDLDVEAALRAAQEHKPIKFDN